MREVDAVERKLGIEWWCTEDGEWCVVKAKGITEEQAREVARQECWGCVDGDCMVEIDHPGEDCRPIVDGPIEVTVWDGEIGDPNLKPREEVCYRVECGR